MPNDDSLETQMASVLWRWKFAEHDERDAILSDSKFASMLEFWFPFSDIEFTRTRGIWCDGVPLLEIIELNPASFLIFGVGYFPHDLTPFELEFHFNSRRELQPDSIILRFGLLDHNGGLRLIGHHKHPTYIMNLRPKTNSEWAVAVELTEPET